ncbi:Xaa-Pro peptidase family protein [Neochlamydia sp. AcF95]|uniref:M24 family metallopeptidase n=1 Tax=Neochlamydia sp. AcF95 TaxID=2795734 RepID=UPI001BC964BC|nr:Xaa-Pro peptidase family protein [Neochlamydia sp. AcF95]MBS4171653.1 Xaa-Pro dipeptidase [Neochlamydia sp. AcF95]
MNFQNRLAKVKKILHDSNLEAFLVEDPTNLYYLTGLVLSAGKLLIKTKSHSALFVDNRYYEYCKNQAPVPVYLSDKTSLESVLEGISTLAFDGETISYQTYVSMQEKFKNLKLVSLSHSLQKIRALKDAQEIAILQEAAQLGMQGYEYIKSLLKEGVREDQLAAELEIFWKKKRAQGVAFDPIIAFGANSALPHYRPAETELREGMTVLFDIGVKWKGYHSDLSRTLFWGEPPAIMRKVYAIVEKAQQRAMALCKPGITLGELDRAARDYISACGYGEHFLHSLGHGVGLEIHEWPSIRDKEPYQQLPLQEGMVITIEPGIYLPGIGGVRIEDTLLITSTGYQVLGS